MALRATEKDGGVTVDIVVQPRAARPGVGPVVGDRLRISVSAPPVDGKANQAVAEVLAGALGLRPSAVALVRGETGRRKTVRIQGATLAALERLLRG
jgi:uncharacterized protein (TIGR00251 family)